MTNADVDRELERMRQSRAARAAELAGAARGAGSPEQRLGLALAPGARVFDPITGQEGVVLGGSRENVVVPTPPR